MQVVDKGFFTPVSEAAGQVSLDARPAGQHDCAVKLMIAIKK